MGPAKASAEAELARSLVAEGTVHTRADLAAAAAAAAAVPVASNPLATPTRLPRTPNNGNGHGSTPRNGATSGAGVLGASDGFVIRRAAEITELGKVPFDSSNVAPLRARARALAVARLSAKTKTQDDCAGAEADSAMAAAAAAAAAALVVPPVPGAAAVRDSTVTAAMKTLRSKQSIVKRSRALYDLSAVYRLLTVSRTEAVVAAPEPALALWARHPANPHCTAPAPGLDVSTPYPVPSAAVSANGSFSAHTPSRSSRAASPFASPAATGRSNGDSADADASAGEGPMTPSRGRNRRHPSRNTPRGTPNAAATTDDDATTSNSASVSASATPSRSPSARTHNNGAGAGNGSGSVSNTPNTLAPPAALLGVAPHGIKISAFAASPSPAPTPRRGRSGHGQGNTTASEAAATAITADAPQKLRCALFARPQPGAQPGAAGGEVCARPSEVEALIDAAGGPTGALVHLQRLMAAARGAFTSFAELTAAVEVLARPYKEMEKSAASDEVEFQAAHAAASALSSSAESKADEDDESPMALQVRSGGYISL